MRPEATPSRSSGLNCTARQTAAGSAAVADLEFERWIARSSVPRYDDDDERVVADVVGRALGDDRAGLEAVDAVADRQDQRQVVLDDDERGVELLLHPLDQRAERLGLALGDARGRLVEADRRAARRRARSRARRCAGCRSTARR